MKRILEVQKKIGKLSKNAKNPFFKSAYLDLSDLLTHVTPLMQENGLILMQPIRDNLVYTQIIDSDNGDVLAESCLMLPNLTDPQKLGSCITYFRRYTLKSLLAIAEGDDDGNLAAKPTPAANNKNTLDDDRFKKAIKSLYDGKAKESDISKYQLTDNQTQALKIALKQINQ